MRGRDFRGLGRAVAVVLTSVLALATPGGATAGDDPPVVDQYVEGLPTAGGERAPKTRSSRAKLPTVQEARLRRLAEGDAAVLEKIATSSTYGAPATSSTYGAPSSERPSSARPQSIPPQRSVAGATVDAASTTGGTRVVVLAICLFLGTCLLVAARIIRVRSPR